MPVLCVPFTDGGDERDGVLGVRANRIGGSDENSAFAQAGEASYSFCRQVSPSECTSTPICVYLGVPRTTYSILAEILRRKLAIIAWL